MTTMGWRGDSYLDRADAVQTYEEARARTHSLKPESWAHYQEIAHAHGLPTGPQLLWPEEWKAGGDYAGYLGTVPRNRGDRSLVSGLQVRQALSISRKTWVLLSNDLRPDAVTAHKSYYRPERVVAHVAANLGRLTKRDTIERLRQALDSWM